MNDLSANIETVYERIEAAARRGGRSAGDISLVAITKTHPLETVIAAYRAGLRHLGENRVQEGLEKIEGLAEWLEEKEAAPPTWHMVGHLQSRKVGDVLGRYQMIHSVDSLKLAERIDRLARRDDYPPVDVLLECNVSGEASKYGFALNNWQTKPAELEAFLADVEQMARLEKLNIQGLMTMAPWYDNPEDTRPTFRSLAALQEKLQQEIPQIEWRHLSMGMTDDFEIAIEEGATLVRIGRAIFGPRE